MAGTAAFHPDSHESSLASGVHVHSADGNRLLVRDRQCVGAPSQPVELRLTGRFLLLFAVVVLVAGVLLVLAGHRGMQRAAGLWIHRSWALASKRNGVARTLRCTPPGIRRCRGGYCRLDACARAGLSRMVGAWLVQRFGAGPVLCAGAPRLCERRNSAEPVETGSGSR